jgi:hypothetical protein
VVDWWFARGHRRKSEVNLPKSQCVCTANLTWHCKALNPAVRAERTASTCLSYGTALCTSKILSWVRIAAGSCQRHNVTSVLQNRRIPRLSELRSSVSGRPCTTEITKCCISTELHANLLCSSLIIEISITCWNFCQVSICCLTALSVARL